MHRLLLATCAALGLAGSAEALTLTFDGIPEGGGEPQPTTIVESGVTISVGSWSDGVTWWSVPDAIHLDDSGTSFTDEVTFETEREFRALSLRLIGMSMSSYVLIDDEPIPVPYDNVLLTGYRDGTLLATARFTTGLDSGIVDYTFGPDFAGLDLLRITNIRPEGTFWEGYPIQCDDAPCGHFSVDDLTIAPVPLPPALPLGVAALGMLALARRYLT